MNVLPLAVGLVAIVAQLQLVAVAFPLLVEEESADMRQLGMVSSTAMRGVEWRSR